MEVLKCVDCENHRIVDNKHWCIAYRTWRRVSETNAVKEIGCEKGKKKLKL